MLFRVIHVLFGLNEFHLFIYFFEWAANCKRLDRRLTLNAQLIAQNQILKISISAHLDPHEN